MNLYRRCLLLFAIATLGLAVCACPSQGQNPSAAGPIAPKKFTFNDPNATLQGVIDELSKQTGLEVAIGGMDGSQRIKAAFEMVPFWDVVDAIAAQTGSRLAIGRRGRFVQLIPVGKETPQLPVSVDGPFRIAATAVEARIDLRTGKRLYDLNMELAWEGGLPVYRIDAHPTLTKTEDNAGRPITVKPFDGRIPVDGVAATIRVPLEGLDRTSNKIALLQGSFRVTAAEEMLRFEFSDLAKASAQSRRGVEASLRRFAKEGTFWVAEIGLRYPPGGATFESFETYWLGRNRLTLIAPDGKAKFTADSEEIVGNSVIYRFKQESFKKFVPMNPKGWKIEYEAPGPLRELLVRFRLRQIDLP